MRYKVSYTITGEYFLDDSEVSEILSDIDEDSSEEAKLDTVTEAINDNPFCTVNPVSDGKVDIKVSQVD